MCDYGTGHLSAFAILLALYHRLRTGEAQHVRASLSGTGTFLQIPFMLDNPAQLRDEPRGQQVKGWGRLYRLYRASDRWFFVAACQPGDSERLARVDGLSQGNSEAELGAAFITDTAETWVTRLTTVGLVAHIHCALAENMMDPDWKCEA